MARTLPRIAGNLSPEVADLAALGRLVRERRAQGALRIDDAADLLGVSKTVLSRVENGRPVSIDKALKILNGLGLTLLLLDRQGASAVLKAQPVFLANDDSLNTNV